MSTTDWIDVRTTDSHATLRLPPGSTSIRTNVGDLWSIDDGTFSYRVVPTRGEAWYDSVRADSTAVTGGWCEWGGGAPTASLGQYVYASGAATGPGYYFQLFRVVGDAREIRLIGYQRDTTRAAVLLAIGRSLRVADGIPARSGERGSAPR